MFIPYDLPRHVRWRENIEYVDIDTGEILTKKQANDKLKYIYERTERFVQYDNAERIRGTITWRKQYRASTQRQLFDPDK